MTNQVKSTIQIVFDYKDGKQVKMLEFQDGGVLVEFNEELKELVSDYTGPLAIEARIKCSNGLVALPSVVGLIRQLNPTILIELYLPYLPHARQDRFTTNLEKGIYNAFTFKHSVVPIINSCNFTQISVLEAHNPSMLALFNAFTVQNVNLIEMLPWLEELKNKVDIVVAPDAGAVKNSEQYAELFGVPLDTASKARDPSNGYIVMKDVYGEDVKDKVVFIADDIIEGGATVMLLAKLLKERGAKEIHVVVTHGLFTKGFEHLLEYVDHIYAYHSWVEVPEKLKDRVSVHELF